MAQPEAGCRSLRPAWLRRRAARPTPPLAGPRGEVHATDCAADAVAAARAATAAGGAGAARVQVHRVTADAELGLASRAPFDAIHVGAALRAPAPPPRGGGGSAAAAAAGARRRATGDAAAAMLPRRALPLVRQLRVGGARDAADRRGVRPRVGSRASRGRV